MECDYMNCYILYDNEGTFGKLVKRLVARFFFVVYILSRQYFDRAFSHLAQPLNLDCI